MKLMRIQIESFAKWKNQTWELSNATMLFGLNEAGKTTILLFVESVLFGFRTPIEDRASGSLLFTDNENRWYIERRQGRTKSGELIVTCNGERIDPSAFLPHIDLPAFRHLYRIDLEQLQHMDDADPEEMNRLLFDTSLTGVLSLFERQKELRKSSMALFKPKGRKTEINVIAKEMDQTKRLLGNWNEKLDRYGLLREELKETDREIKQASAVETTLQEEQKTLELKQLLAPLAGKWGETHSALEKETKLPEHANKAFESLQKNLSQLEKETEIIEAKLEEPEAVSYSQADITELGNLIESFAKADMFERQQTESNREMEQLKEEILSLIDSVPKDVNLEQVGVSPPLVKRLEDLNEQHRQLKMEEKQLEKQQTQSGSDKSAGILKYLPYGFLAAGSLALLFQEWISGGLFLLIGIGLLISNLSNVNKESSTSSLNAMKKDWEELFENIDHWCDDAGLPYGLDLHTYQYALKTAEKCHDLKQRKERAEKIKLEAESWISQKKQEASSWTRKTDASSAEQLQALKSIHAQAVESVNARREKELKQAEYRERIQEMNIKINQMKRELQEWLLAAGADTEQEFWKVYQKDEELRKLKQDAVETWQQICAVVPNETTRNQLLEEIFAEKFIEKRAVPQERLNDASSKKEALYEKRTELTIELKQMEEGGTYAQLQQKYEQQKQELTSLVKRWAVYETAVMLVDDVRDVYEKEKQPNVLKDAESRFAKMTEGRYKHVHVPVGEKKFLVEREDGKTFAPADLSRGTRELLYVSLRLALIKEHPSLPICLDEAIVNMDQPRRNALWKELASVAKDHQVLFFTCHEHIMKEWETELQGIVYKL